MPISPFKKAYTIPSSAENIDITDAGAYFTGTTIEAMGQEIGAQLGQIAPNGAVMTNLITNGNFSNGTTGWLGQTANISADSNELTVLSSAQFGWAYQTKSIINGHKYYACAKVKSTALTGLISLSCFNGAIDVFTFYAGSGNYERLSLVFIAASNLTNNPYVFQIKDGRASDWDSIYVQYAMLIDMTALFGSGNEPSVMLMDTILTVYLNSWFDGNATITEPIQSGISKISYVDPTIIDNNVFTDSLVIGGGGKLISRTGTNPVDPLTFEADGSYNGLYNTFLGRKSGESNTTGNGNTFVGSGAGKTNINGDQNTFLGWWAGYKNTNGYHNTFLGVGAGQENTTGFFNTLVGCDSGLSMTTGSSNVAIGASTLGANTSGSGNIALGSQALEHNVSGSQNIGIGTYAAMNILNNQNTCIGYAAMNAAGGVSNNNTAIGYAAGYSMTLGIGNTFIGASAGYNAGQAVELSNSMALGNGAYTTATNTVQIGNADIINVASHGDFETQDIGDGFICKSPDGTRYRITVANGGTIAIAAA